MRILLIEDNTEEADMIKRGLVEDGHAVDVALNAVEGEELAAAYPYDLIVLDLNLPDRDGVELCREIRDKKNHARILMLTGRDSVKDRVRGLDAGADDYLVKPFDFAELSARVRALARREITRGSPLLKYGDIAVNISTREVRRGNRPIKLTNTEYRLLTYLMQNQHAVVTRRMIEDHVWDMMLDSNSNIIEVHILHLREKLDDTSEDSIITTVRSVGYRLKSNEDSS